MQEPIIRLRGASVERAGRRLVEEVDWALVPGEHWALLGANGAGKSTLMRLARGEVPPTSGSRLYCFDGKFQRTPIGIRHRMAMVSSDMHDAYALGETGITAREVALAGFFDSPLLYQEPTPEMHAACDRTFALLGLEELAPRRARELSSGELRKVLVARALATGADVLFLDECMNGLDAPSREALLRVLERAAGSAQLVVAAHRREELPACVNRALLLCGGRVALDGDLEDALVLQEARGRERDAVAGPAPEWSGPGGRGERVLFSLKNGGHVLRGRTILADVDWTVRGGECWALLGDNGAGKSTLIRLLLGLVDPLLGTEIRWFGHPGLPEMTEVRRRVGFVSAELQTGYGYDLSVQETVWSGFFGSIGLYEEVSPEQRARAAETLEFFGLSRLAGRPFSQLSQGQARRVLLARAVAPGPELLFLDEPTAGLDPPSRRRTLALLQALAESGMTLVLVTHHEDELLPAVRHVLRLEGGRVACCGPR
jgi:molybdate transport system ATP-binding protein